MTFIDDFLDGLYPFIILFLPFAGNNPAEKRNWNAKNPGDHKCLKNAG
jgi:hypothetical protein